MTEDERLLLIVLGFAGVGVCLTIVVMFKGVAGCQNWSVLSSLPGPNETGRTWARRVLPTVTIGLLMVAGVVGLCLALLGGMGEFNLSVGTRWILGTLSSALAILVGLLYGRTFSTMERKKP